MERFVILSNGKFWVISEQTPFCLEESLKGSLVKESISTYILEGISETISNGTPRNISEIISIKTSEANSKKAFEKILKEFRISDFLNEPVEDFPRKIT